MIIPLRALIVEDVADDAELMIVRLTQEGFNLQWQRVTNEAEYVAALATPPDVILSAWVLPQFGGLRALQLLHERNLDIPFIIVSGSIGEEAIVDAMRRGAYDYVPKDRPVRLGQAVKRALTERELRLAKQNAEKALLESEQRFRRLTENAPDLIYRYEITPRHGFTYVSPATTTIIGYTPEEYYADPNLTFNIVHPDDRPVLEKSFQGTFKPSILLRLIRKDGNVIWVEARHVPIYDEAAKLVAVEGIARDISERKRAEEQVRKLLRAVEQSPASIVITDTAGCIEYVNPKFTRLTGYTLAEVVGQNPRILKSGETPPAEYRNLWNTLLAGQNWHGEFHNRKKNGELYWEAASISPIVDETGTITHFVAIKEDITIRKQIEETQLFLAQCGSQGDDFFTSLARYLAKSLGMDYICIDRLGEDPANAQTVTIYFDGKFEDNLTQRLQETPCGQTVGKAFCCFHEGVRHLFPEHVLLQEMQAESYVGTTLWGANGRPIGLIAAIGRRPLADPQVAETLLRLVVVRAAGELERKQAEEALHRALEKSQQQQAEIAALLAGARAVLEYHDFRSAVQDIFTFCQSLIGATAGYVALSSEDNPLYEILFLLPEEQPRQTAFILSAPVQEFCAGAYRSKEVVYCNDLSDGEFGPISPTALVTPTGVLSVPLIVQGKALGLMVLANKPTGFTDNDARIAGAFGELAAIALLNGLTLESLQYSEERFRVITQTAGEAIISINEGGMIVFWNNAAQAIFGYSADEMLGQSFLRLTPEHLHGTYRQYFEQLVSTGDVDIVGQITELTGLRKGNFEFPLELSLAKWKTREGTFFTAIVHDITARQAHEAEMIAAQTELRRLLAETEQARQILLGVLEEQAQIKTALTAERLLLRTLVDHLPVAVYAKDAAGRMMLANSVAVQNSGVASETELLGKTVFELFPPELATRRQADDRTIIESGRPILNREEKVPRPDGTFAWQLVSQVPLHDNEGRIIGLVEIDQDITERKQIEEQIKASLREKEVLLKEIHHRVKNNMQIISSLLSLQAEYIKDPQAFSSFKESQERIRSMALIHEKLYQSHDLAHINFAEYINDLSVFLYSSYTPALSHIALKVDVEDIYLDIGHAVPCGLIVNELVTNALKYAFPAGRSGEIKVAVCQEGNRYTLTVSDNGVGFPPHVDFRKTSSFGMQLVIMLVRQLNGIIELEAGGGTTFTITFEI